MVIKRKNEIDCIVCKNIIKFPEYVGQDYNGDLFCDTCGLLLSVKLEKGKVKGFKVKEKIEGWKGYKKLMELQEMGRKLMYPESDDKGGG